MRKLYVIVPKRDFTGPIKGAAALCNGLCEFFPGEFDIHFIALKGTSKDLLPLHPDVKFIDLSKYSSKTEKRTAFESMIETNAVVVSFCYSADLFNLRINKPHIRISSIRANLIENYKYTYGAVPGRLLAVHHYRFLRGFDRILAISQHMKNELESGHGFKSVELVCNFVDETSLQLAKSKRATKKNSNAPFHFMFVGGLTNRKRPELLLQAFAELIKTNPHIMLTYIGDGNLKSALLSEINRLGLKSNVHMLGQLKNPYEQLQAADCFVLPSESEGISRAALEALYYGIPCILRDVDANSELIKPGESGLLFRRDGELVDCLKRALTLSPQNHPLIPSLFRQQTNLNKFREIISGFY